MKYFSSISLLFRSHLKFWAAQGYSLPRNGISVCVSVASGSTYLLIQEYALHFLSLVRQSSQTTAKFTNAVALDEVGKVNI